jgi:Reverse transcriptase (RNA-dependent DNA polymerase).
LSPTTSSTSITLPTPPTTTPTTTSQSPAATSLPLSGLPKELGKCITRDVALLNKLGWKRFVAARRHRKDLADMHINHPAKRLLLSYKKQGVPAKVTTPRWSPERIRQAIARGPHRSCREHTEFLSEEFVSMIQKGQWTILPFSAVKEFVNLRISPPGVVPQRDRRPRWIVDYSFYDVNEETLPLVAEGSMQFGHTLERILRHILLSDPSHGPVYLIKIDISDGFYRIDMNPDDIPRLGVVFPTEDGQEPLIAFPLVLPMGWKNSPPAFTTATETIADLANGALKAGQVMRPHPLDVRAAKLDNIGESREESFATPHITPDPSIPPQEHPLAEVDVYVDDFIAVAQGDREQLRNVRATVLHSIDSVFRPNDERDPKTRSEPVSLKKLDKGDASWNTNHTILGWDIDTTQKTITLPAHRKERLAEVLDSIPPHQKRIGVTKWHKVLGELRSMSLALPGSRGLFSSLQKALQLHKGKRVALNKDVHQALRDFRWILNNLTVASDTYCRAGCRCYHPALGHHDASGTGAGGVWFPAQGIHPRHHGNVSAPLLWRFQWPQKIARQLITDKNPNGTISISDLELAGGLLHLDVLCQHYDARERTILSKTDNLATLYWQRKGSATSDKVPPHLLRLFGIHQRLHRYVPRHDYIPGGSNPLADDASRLFHFTDCEFLTHFNNTYPQPHSYHYVTPTPSLISAVISALLKKPYNVALLRDKRQLQHPLENLVLFHNSVGHRPLSPNHPRQGTNPTSLPHTSSIWNTCSQLQSRPRSNG